MHEMMLGLRVDVDTLTGLARGVPRLLGLLAELRLRATFFVPMGPDRMGRNAVRILKEEGLIRLSRKYAGIYPKRIMLNGTLVAAPRFHRAGARTMMRIVDSGHELGLHSFDHSEWQSRVEQLSREEIEDDYKKCILYYAEVVKELPRCSAAPGWRATERTLFSQDGFGFDYASDARGHGPFYPLVGGILLRTLQVPVTLPTLDELLLQGREMFELPRSGVSVYCAHAELEGLSRFSWFNRFLKEALERGALVVPLSTIARSFTGAPGCTVASGRVPGRSSPVLLQVRQ